MPRVLLLSSAAVYGSPTSLPMREDMMTKPISPYGYHKHLQEMILTEYFELFGIRCCAARIFSTYGPGLRHLAGQYCEARLSNHFSLQHAEAMKPATIFMRAMSRLPFIAYASTRHSPGRQLTLHRELKSASGIWQTPFTIC